MSRYEEHLPHIKDKYERFDAKKAFYQNNFLHRPLINLWIEELKKIINYFSIFKFPTQ